MNRENQDRAQLVLPSVVYRESFLEALAESQSRGERLRLSVPVLHEDFDGFVATLLQGDDRARLQPGQVPQSTFWLVGGGTYIGRLSLRHELNENLMQIGGNIGYDMRPSMRRQGYGTLALRLGLVESRKIGLQRVLVTCDRDNIGSRRIIEANGGVLQDEITIPGVDGQVRRYWINL
jgi:predicted acetyltransferase